MDGEGESDRQTPPSNAAGSLGPAELFWRNKTVDLSWPMVGGFSVPALEQPDEGPSLIGKRYSKSAPVSPNAGSLLSDGRAPEAMGLPPSVEGPARQQAIQDYADMRADLRDWAAAWFDSYTELETDSGHWRRWCHAFLGSMFRSRA